MPHRFLLRTALFRLTLLHAAVFLGLALVLAIGGALFLSVILEGNIRSEIESELDGLMIEFDRRGRGATAEAIENRLADEGLVDFDYLLQDRNGVVLAGTLPAMQAGEGWIEVVTPEGEADEPAIAKGLFLFDGSFLAVARDSESLYESRDFIFETLGWSFGLALPLALLGGIATSMATLRRIEAINRATATIRRNGLSERVPVGQTDDEFNRLARNINAMLDGIAELTEQVRQVTNDVAHDLRTPLTRLRQDLERARQDPRRESTGELIDSSIARIDEVLDTFSSLLRISRIESGSGGEQFANLDLSSLSRELAETFESVAEDNDKVLTCDIADGLTVRGDKPLLRQMIVNLIENAIQHTPPGTAIRFELGRDASGIHAVVADNGPGVPAWAREKVLRRFFRLDRSRQSRGNGLGLSLVAAIAKHHGVALTLSDNHPGLRVRLDFPDSSWGGVPLDSVERVSA